MKISFGKTAAMCALVAMPTFASAETVFFDPGLFVDRPEGIPFAGQDLDFDLSPNFSFDFTVSIQDVDGSEKAEVAAVGQVQFMVDNDGDAVDVTGQDQVDNALAMQLDAQWSSLAGLYLGSSGPLGMVGDMITLGFRAPQTPFVCQSEDDKCPVFVQAASSMSMNANDEYELTGAEDEPGYAFGWLEITRGSLSSDSAGLNRAGAAILPNPNVVPLPAGLPLLVAGMGAFAWLRRRQG